MSEQSNIQVEQQQSVEIKINAKGQFSGGVKVYAATIDEAFTLALTKAKELEVLINEKNTR